MPPTEQKIKLGLVEAEAATLRRKLEHAMNGLMLVQSILFDIRHEGIRGLHKLPRRYFRIERAIKRAADLIANDLPF